eukprot:TRINITY_DN879_c0_g1_i1.p1 TRINITY_DN879_c0_g1~~TRINITY_DN879_c0_g1_i1.p1  ORF type:complete len:346 (+),score=48.72 TRINITY_DN879_c0_g1_i1:149-1186(+)
MQVAPARSPSDEVALEDLVELLSNPNFNNPTHGYPPMAPIQGMNVPLPVNKSSENNTLDTSLQHVFPSQSRSQGNSGDENMSEPISTGPPTQSGSRYVVATPLAMVEDNGSSVAGLSSATNNSRKRRKETSCPVSADELRAKKNECEKRRILEIAGSVDMLRKEVHNLAPGLDCSSKLACLQSALSLLQTQRDTIIEISGMPVPRMVGNASADPYGTFKGGPGLRADAGMDMDFMFRNGSCACAVMSISGNVLDMNTAFMKMCGVTNRSPENIANLSMIKLTPAEELPAMMQAVSELLVGNVPKINVNKTCRAPQHDFAVNVDLSVVLDSQGKPNALICSAVPRR